MGTEPESRELAGGLRVATILLMAAPYVLAAAGALAWWAWKKRRETSGKGAL